MDLSLLKLTGKFHPEDLERLEMVRVGYVFVSLSLSHLTFWVHSAEDIALNSCGYRLVPISCSATLGCVSCLLWTRDGALVTTL